MSARCKVGALLIACAAIIPGCEKPAEPPAPAVPAASSAALAADEAAALRSFVESERSDIASAPRPSAATGLPANHPPLTPPPAASGLPAGHPPVGGGGELKYEPSTEWKPVQPSSSMRRAQFVLPRAAGDGEDGELVVFYFGPGEGGSVADNLDRWRGMFQSASGEPVSDADATHEAFETNGLRVTLLDVAGRYAPSMMPGVPNTGPRDDFRMLAAVVETPGGPWFFRALGPRETVARHREPVVAMLKSVRY